MAYNTTTGVFTRVANVFSNPVTGTVIDPDGADELFDDYDLGLSIVHGKLIPPVGTATLAPLQLTAGTNLTTAAAGAVEYDGKAIYDTPNALNRGVRPATHFLSLAANQTGTDGNSAQPWFPGGGATVITLPALTSYFFEGVLAISKTAGTVSHTIGLLFGGTATLTSIGYCVSSLALDAGFNPSTAWISYGQSISNFVQTAASTSATRTFVAHVRGIVRINAAGTFSPVYQLSAAPGGAYSTQANSHFRMWPVGINTVLNVGNWS